MSRNLAKEPHRKAQKFRTKSAEGKYSQNHSWIEIPETMRNSAAEKRQDTQGSSREENEEEERYGSTKKSLEFESWKEKEILRQRKTGAQYTNNFLPCCAFALESRTLRAPLGHRAAGCTLTHTSSLLLKPAAEQRVKQLEHKPVHTQVIELSFMTVWRKKVDLNKVVPLVKFGLNA